MDNKVLYTKKYEDSFTIKNVMVEEEKFTVITDEKKEIVFESKHDQDCCEHVYADFSVMKYHADELKGQWVREIVIKGVEEMGFALHLGSKKIFVPCYNSQNGYYSSNLAIVITEDGVKTEIDLRGFVEDDID